MIDALLDIFYMIAEAALGLLPEYVPSNTDAFSGFFGVISTINRYFPVDTLASCVTAYLSFVVILAGVRLVLKFARLA